MLCVAGAAPDRMDGLGQGVPLRLLGRRPDRGPRRGLFVANPRRTGSGVCMPRDRSVAPRTRSADARHLRQPLVDVARVPFGRFRRRRALARVDPRQFGDPRARPTTAASTTTARTPVWHNLTATPSGFVEKKKEKCRRFFIMFVFFSEIKTVPAFVRRHEVGKIWGGGPSREGDQAPSGQTCHRSAANVGTHHATTASQSDRERPLQKGCDGSGGDPRHVP